MNILFLCYNSYKIMSKPVFLLFICFLLVFNSNILNASPIPKAPELDVESYAVMDYDSGSIIISKNPTVKLPPASITKIMTSYIAFLELKDKSLNIDDNLLVSKKAWKTEGSKMFIEVGKKVSIRDILQGIVISSGNDASVAIAEHISGNEETFALYMNQIAESLGMKNTNYVNSNGLPDNDQYTTAEDIALLSRALIKNFPIDYKLYSQKQYVYNEIKQYSRNKLLYIDDRVDGIKTGYTKRAGYCLAASSKRGNRRLITVVLGAKTPGYRVDASKALLNYGFRFYETHKLFRKDAVVSESRIYNGEKKMIKLTVEDDFFISLPRRQLKNIRKQIVVDTNLVAPMKKNTAIGYILIKLDGKVISKTKLIASEDVSEGNIYRKTIDSVIQAF